jgi:alpha-tubulin suppressor-like RCC1 family protein
MILTQSGKVHVCGLNNIGQLGINSGDLQLNSLTSSHELSSKHLKEIACGDTASYGLTNHGALYEWGNISYKPVLLVENTKFKSIQASYSGFCAAID